MEKRNFTEAEISGMKELEQEWLMKVKDMNEHPKLMNPYEVSGERGKPVRVIWLKVFNMLQASTRPSFSPILRNG